MKQCLSSNCPDKKSICCGEKAIKNYHVQTLPFFLCSKCNVEFIGNPCTAGDQVTDLGKLIEEAQEEFWYSVNDENACWDYMEEYITKAYVLGYDASRSEV